MPEKNDEIFNHFGKITVIDSVTNTLSWQYRDKIIFFENADSVAVTLTLQGLMEMKNNFKEKNKLLQRGRDSNPRNSFPFTHFPGVLLQPLGHLSF